MIAANSLVELIGPRVAHHRPPKGVSSRIVTIRPRRCFHQPRQGGAFTPLPNPIASLCRHACKRNISNSVEKLTESETDLMSYLVHKYSPEASWNPQNQDKAATRYNDGGRTQEGQGVRSGGVVGAPSSVMFTETQADHVGLDALPEPFRRALVAMQDRDSRRLLKALKQIVSMAEEDLVSAVAALPRTTFSEFLRSFDPMETGRANDPTHDVRVGIGMWTILNLNHVIDDWGVRKIYIRLLQRMLNLMSAFQKTERLLSVDDYTPLFRAAASTSDIAGAKLLWYQMKIGEVRYWKRSDHIAEFVSARFLTHPTYYGYDKTRIMVRPRSLHRQALKLSQRKLDRLDRIRLNTRIRAARFNLNKDIPYAEDLSRILRKRLPATRLFWHTLKSGAEINEKLLCIFMRAFARSGSMRFIRHYILEDFFNISPEGQGTSQIKIGPAKTKTTTLKIWARPWRPRIRPTVRLLYAVVEAYCSNGHIATAFHLVDYISHKFSVRIPPRIWTELLEWTHIMSTPPNSTAWKMAGLGNRVPSPEAIEMIWNTMTAVPYTVRPGPDQYVIMIRSLISRRLYDRAAEFMSTMRELYNVYEDDYEKAVFAYTRALRDGLNGIAISLFSREYMRARFMKQKMWFQLSETCKILLRRFRARHPHDVRATQNIPNFIKEFREFVPNPSQYRISSGDVTLRDPSEELLISVLTSRELVEVPMKYRRQWHFQRLKSRRRAILSSHMLADQQSAKLNPLPMLIGGLETFRTPQAQWYRDRKRARGNSMAESRE